MNVPKSLITVNKQLTKKEYNYLLPVLKENLFINNNNYFFHGTIFDIKDMSRRLEGLYW